MSLVRLYVYELGASALDSEFSTDRELTLADANQTWHAREMFHHGVISSIELESVVTSRTERDELLKSGRIQKLCRGWFAMPAACADAVRAIMFGGRLGCVSGCRAHGLWVPPHQKLHVLLNPGRQVPNNPGVEFHRITRPCHTAVASLEDCLSQVIQRHDAETALIVLESAVELRKLHVADASQIMKAAPNSKARALDLFRTGAGSGSETRVRLFLQRRNVTVRTQVAILGVGTVDMLVGKSLIVECDSEAHHSSPAQYEEDRRRDMAARQLGYEVIRLSYAQIWHSWEQTQAALIAELATRRHRRPPQPRAL